MNEAAKKVWVEGFQSQFSTEALQSLAEALEVDDPRLTQGSTTVPPPLMCFQDWAVEGCCGVAWSGVEECGGFSEATAGEVEECFARYCFNADKRMGEPAACRHWLNWFDDTPRHQMRAELLALVQEELQRRAAEYVLNKNAELYRKLA